MSKYEAMFIMKPDLSEEERKALFNQINEIVNKNQGNVTQGSVWAERRKFFFPLKKCHEGLYYLLNFSISPLAVKEMQNAFNLNENILRVLISVLD